MWVAAIAVTTAMKGGGGVGECPHAGVLPLHPIPHPQEKNYEEVTQCLTEFLLIGSVFRKTLFELRRCHLF
jgi:hypothetical protein